MQERNIDRLPPVCALTGGQTCNVLVHRMTLQPADPLGQDCTCVFSIFIDQCDHQHDHFGTCEAPQKKKPYTLFSVSFISPQTVDLPILCISYKWNHTICDTFVFGSFI